MSKEFKVIIGKTAGETYVMVDNQPIGYIQEIKFSVGVDKSPEVEIVFPDLRPFSVEAAKTVADQIALLTGLPQVKVKLQKVDPIKT
jgi:hypothetical protein